MVEGHVDFANLSTVRGWAYDPSKGGEPILLNIFINDRSVAEIRANQFREDLASAGIGGGYHAFEAPISKEMFKVGENLLAVKDVQNGQLLKGAPIKVEKPNLIEYFAGDIVDNCNLRCPFCLVDYTNVKTTNKMSEETFLKLIQLMPAVEDGNFFISCLHEPTLHPRLFDFLEMIPEELRIKNFFTTNLCKPISDRGIEVLANSNFHHINVSMDTLDEDLFGVLRKGGRPKIFLKNLHRLTEAFAGSDRAPELRFITMAYSSNLEEIPKLVAQAFEEFGAGHHEIRYTYNVRHITDQFRKEHFLSREKWVWLKTQLDNLEYPIDVVLPPGDYEKAFVRSTNYWEVPGEEGFPATVPDLPISLRGAWDGTVRIRKREEHFSVNINILPDPARFFLAF